ncbi:RNA polymerase II elongation factor ELL2-like [Ochotona princeps]|uniref:RNA polymerase II elongation factor ELL2-like n=1 Tax=Ochotona princeps TaxID=9978 RepID=UPI002714FEC8|nr:RNA polymerase II elongation factor ELL2-like [Ochotona princeps]
MDRFKCLNSLGGKVVGEFVYRDGKLVFQASNITEPRQQNVFGRALEPNSPVIPIIYSHLSCENVTPPPISTQIQELQGLFKIPTNKLPSNVSNTNFRLPNVKKDDHQVVCGSTEQAISSCNVSQLMCIKPTQDQMTESIQTSSCPMTKQAIAQPKEDSTNKWKKYMRAHMQRKLPVRRAPQGVPDLVPERKKTAPINPAYTVRKSRVSHSVHTRPYRDRVIHLLALRDYKKSELLIRLQKDGAPKNDKDTLETILQEVAHLNSTNLSYSLKDDIFQEIQKDWPGYNDLDRQSLELVLSIKADPMQNAANRNFSESTISITNNDALFPEKQLFSAVNVSTLIKKKVRISHLTTMSPSAVNIHLNRLSARSSVGLLPSGAKSPPPLKAPCEMSYTTPILDSDSDSSSTTDTEQLEIQDPYADSTSSNSSIFDSPEREPTPSEMLPSVSAPTEYSRGMQEKHLQFGDKFQYKSMQQKAQQRNNHTDVMGTWKIDSARQDEKANCSIKLEKVSAASKETFETYENPDYLTNYFPIVSYEQREHYAQEFKAQYEEYQALYAKMKTLSSVFLELDSRRKHFPSNSKEYQEINEKIILEYQKMRERNPSYEAEKQRFMYLYNKLLYIKNLVRDFDQQQINLEH